MTKWRRRGFLRVAGGALLGAGLPGGSRAVARRPGGPERARFPQGVASGDPRPDGVILWTRSPAPGAPGVELLAQLGETAQFAEPLVEAPVTALAADDFTVRADIDGLRPGQRYYYRFLGADGASSPIGRTMTAPDPDDPRPVHLAFASCQNFEQGYFGAWARMLEEDRKKPEEERIQFVLHLGDFIYERRGRAGRDGQRHVRELPAFPDGDGDGESRWADSLADYRHLYRHYLADPQLQAARGRWPFICTWDDHEFSNDCAGAYSTYRGRPRHQPLRRRNASQAWLEYIPARVAMRPENPRIHRGLGWGRHVDLLLTDSRSYRSHAPLPSGLVERLGLSTTPAELVEICDAGAGYNGGQPPARLPFGAGTQPNPARARAPGTLLGAGQKAWLKNRLRRSRATWKVWGNALPALSLRLDLEAIPWRDLHTSVLGTDAWAGFPGEYRELMDFIGDSGIANVVSLSGDHHAHGAGALARDPGAPDAEFVAVDFNVSAISSTPQFSEVLRRAREDNPELMQLAARETGGGLVETWNMTLAWGALAALAYDRTGSAALANWLAPNRASPGTVYVDSNSNGYGLARFDGQCCSVRLVTIEPPLAPDAHRIRHVANFRLAAWRAREQPHLPPPRFDGAAPFPFT